MKWTVCGHEISYDRLELAHCKVAVFGEKGTGKTTLVQQYGADLVDAADGQIHRIYRSTCEIRGHPGVQLEIWDIPGEVSCSPQYAIPSDVDLIVLCVDISRPHTLDALTTRWLRRVRESCPHQPLLIVGCKCDLRNDLDTISLLAQRKQIAVTFSQASLIAKLAGAVAYIETTAKRCPNSVQPVFEVAALHHVGKLSRNHLVFQRQRSVEKRQKNVQAKAKKTASNTTKKPKTPSPVHSRYRICQSSSREDTDPDDVEQDDSDRTTGCWNFCCLKDVIACKYKQLFH